MTHRTRGVASIGIAAMVWAASTVAHAQVDTLRSAADAVPSASAAGFGAFDRIARETYLRRHAFSLDHFLELEPGGFVVRLGPIGSEASYSRWGIGRGRALLLMNGIALNDPQDDTAPLVHTPTSGLGTLSMARDTKTPWIEGVVEIDEATPPVGRPNTFVELSKGTNAVRQRRVRFSSEASKIGVDLAYDEVLDDGYPFDAGGEVPYVSNYGSARSRQSTIALRGEPDAGTRFGFGVRNFTSTTQGDLTSNTSEGRKSGHVAWLDASVESTKLTLFARGYSSSVPDSSAENETVGAQASWSRTGPASSEIALRAGVERTNAIQDVGAIADDHVVRVSTGADASRNAGEHGRVTASATVTGDEETPFAWGASIGARREDERTALGVSLARSFRLPNFGERYLPAHVDSVGTIAGDADIDPETAWEVAGDWDLRFGGSTLNRVRASWIRAEGAIAFRPRAVGTETWRVAANAAESSRMLFVEERLSGVWHAATLRILGDAAFLYTNGDREDAFASVPEYQANASILFGRDFFEETSALFLGAQVIAAGERNDYDGVRLPKFEVLNLMLEGRLLDARIYLQYLNALDQAYATQGGYLMTPRTFVYGIEWTLFN